MSKVLIIGNVLKDVYLRLDERKNDFETDGHGIDWLDLAFNGSAHGFFRRTAVYGGAAVSLATLARLGIDARIMGSRTEYKNGEIIWQDRPEGYRYILCHEGQITYFVPSSREVTNWVAPSSTAVEWILVDRSTVVSERLVEEIKNFIKFSPATKLAVHAEKHMTPSGKELAKMADILFTEDEPPVHTEEKIVDKIEMPKINEQLVCHITPRKIVLGDAEESWALSRTDMLTHLTVYSTIVATVLGVVSVGGSAADAVLWARINAEQATLESSLSARKLQELAKAEKEKRASAKLVAKSLMVGRKGILAADEDDNQLTERLVEYSIPANSKTRIEYREMLLTTPELKDYASGVILTPEVAQEKVVRDVSYAEYLTTRGVITGVKASTGQAKLENTDETYTTGITDIAERLKKYYEVGARFAKWHVELVIDKDQPSFRAVERGAELAADFAKECQLAGLVAMIESDVKYDGDYSAEKCAEVTDRVLMTIFRKLEERNVDLETVILKTNMVTSGKDAVAPSTPREVGMATAAILKHAAPSDVAGVLLLGGGQDAKTATANLKAIMMEKPYEWPVSFAFSRALQGPVMATWKGKAENRKAAQAALKRHLQENADLVR